MLCSFFVICYFFICSVIVCFLSFVVPSGLLLIRNLIKEDVGYYGFSENSYCVYVARIIVSSLTGTSEGKFSDRVERV